MLHEVEPGEELGDGDGDADDDCDGDGDTDGDCELDEALDAEGVGEAEAVEDAWDFTLAASVLASTLVELVREADAEADGEIAARAASTRIALGAATTCTSRLRTTAWARMIVARRPVPTRWSLLMPSPSSWAPGRLRPGGPAAAASTTPVAAQSAQDA